MVLRNMQFKIIRSGKILVTFEASIYMILLVVHLIVLVSREIEYLVSRQVACHDYGLDRR